MNSLASQHFLFPHLTLTEKDYRHLSILLPQLFLLEVTRPLDIPAWAQETFTAWPVAREEEARESIQRHLRTYQDFAGMHGTNGLMASLRREWTEVGAGDSRFRIQSRLKGKDEPEQDTPEQLFQEAAVFMELARSLDESETELEKNYGRVAQLEEEFRQIIGIVEGEEPDPALEVSAHVLMSEKAHLAFMLPTRISHWFRLLRHQLPAAAPVLVSIIPDVAEEVLDCLPDQHKTIAKAEQTLQVPLVSMPTLEYLPAELFQTLRQELTAADRLQPLWNGLQAVLANPADSSQLEHLHGLAQNLHNQVKAFCNKHSALEEKEVTLYVTHLEQISPAGLWEKYDKKGSTAWSPDSRLQGATCLLSLQ